MNYQPCEQQWRSSSFCSQSKSTRSAEQLHQLNMHVQMTMHSVFRIRLRFERQIPVVARCNNLRQRSPIIEKTIIKHYAVYCWIVVLPKSYRGADKSLARTERKQASVSVRMSWISFVAVPCKKKKLDDSSRLDVVEKARVPDMLPSLFLSWSG